MKQTLLSAVLVLIAIVTVLSITVFSEYTDRQFTVSQIPHNNVAVAGISTFITPPISRDLPPPILSARAILIRDVKSDTTLYHKDSNVRLPIASTTKVMTAMVASEYFKLDSVLEVGDSAGIDGASVGLMKGEKITFNSLLLGMLLNSGNDAAFTIAENYPGGLGNFVLAMNQKVARMKLPNTHFDNPAGFDSPTHFSSANDLARITQEAIKDQTLAKIFSTKETEVLSFDSKYRHKLSNLNILLSEVHGVLGVKTGYTREAKENLITLVNRGSEVIVVVLGSDDRFSDSKALIEWTYNNFVWSK